MGGIFTPAAFKRGSSATFSSGLKKGRGCPSSPVVNVFGQKSISFKANQDAQLFTLRSSLLGTCIVFNP